MAELLHVRAHMCAFEQTTLDLVRQIPSLFFLFPRMAEEFKGKKSFYNLLFAFQLLVSSPKSNLKM